MADDTTVIAVVGILGIVAVAGLFLFAMMRSSAPTGSIAVVDAEGNLLYTVSDQAPRRVVGQVDFRPA